MQNPQAGRMNNRHLPAGQPMPGGGNVGATGGDMVGGPGSGPGGGGRRRQQPQGYAPAYHQQFGPYSTYMPPPYQPYYTQLAPQFQNGVMPSPGYIQYPPYNARSPPTMQQYVPMASVGVQQTFARQSQNSPGLSTPYQPPPAPPQAVVLPPQTPSSTNSSQAVPRPATPQTPQASDTAAPTAPIPQSSPSPSPAVTGQGFRAPLPWLSRPDLTWPEKATKSRRRRRVLADNTAAVRLPMDRHDAAASRTTDVHTSRPGTDTATESAPNPASAQSTNPITRSDTPSTQGQASEGTSTLPTTPSSANPAAASNASVTPTNSGKHSSRTAVPALPIIPAVPRAGSKDKAAGVERPQGDDKQPAGPSESADVNGPSSAGPEASKAEPATQGADLPPAPAPAAAPKPMLWSGLFDKSSQNAKTPAGQLAAAPDTRNGGTGPGILTTRNGSLRGLPKVTSDSMVEALRAFRVGAGEKLSFIEPRGLVNGGNMCYMNSVLQVLLYCTPFYDFLDQVSKKATHSFKSETPLLDAMIMFMREFRVIESASSVEKLKEGIAGKEKAYGDPMTPNHLYDEVKKSKWFATLEQGHQQDAEEFLSALLEALDDECARVLTGGSSSAPGAGGDSAVPPPGSSGDAAEAGDDWREVGPKRRTAITRSSGWNPESPIFKIFGGLIRSELTLYGKEKKVNIDPYRPLQLDIVSPHVRNITDALRGITSREKLDGDFGSARGSTADATIQLSIEELPPVLILQLKRFQFDVEGGTVKVSKKVGYPLELEIPREALSKPKLKRLAAAGTGMPKYRLIAVVYHHGKNASVGHYTVDVRRQDGVQWIRLDDTKIEAIRSEDVAKAGAEEDQARDVRKDGGASGPSANRFGGMNEEEGGDDEGGWKQVTGVNGNKRWSSVLNGTRPTASKGKQVQETTGERTVPYLLFYQKM